MSWKRVNDCSVTLHHSILMVIQKVLREEHDALVARPGDLALRRRGHHLLLI
jgi:hypothetical protein